MSEIHAIVMPKWGLSMAEGALSQWNVDIGVIVQAGDVIADIETEKIINELAAHVNGTLRRQLVLEGETALVGELLGVIANEEVSEEAIDTFVCNYGRSDSSAAKSVASAAPPLITEPTMASTERSAASTGVAAIRVPDALLLADGASSPDGLHATHLARKFADKWRIDLSSIAGTGRRNRISKSDVQRAIAAAGGAVAAVAATSAGDVRATPMAKRLATQLDVNLADVVGTGAQGRITKHDVIAASNPVVLAAPSSLVATSSVGVEVPLSSTRRLIARRLSESKQTIPHFRIAIDILIDELLALRTQLNYDGREQHVSVNDMLVKAAAAALVQIPEVNAQYSGGVLKQFGDADIAIAVALGDGLITPIVRAANRKDFSELSCETAALIARAKDGLLRLDEIEGGTFTLSNLGMFGVSAFDAIINQPQVAILAVGAAEKKRIFVEDEEIIGFIMRATLSCDHRIVDGALGAKFMQSLKQIIEQPGRLLT